MTTPYHAKYFAHELTRQGGVGIERLSRSLFDACVDLNPHQIESALFAMRSPISKGVLLADEVGLGKTIEAGIVLCQYWAEKKRRILVICPASLRKQWALELEEKFNLPYEILDAKSYKTVKESGNLNPFDTDKIVIVSMHFASSHASDIKTIPWNIVAIDEAHKLRNAYRQSNRMGQNIRWALEDRRKILLTATPLQNSLLELYGLATIIDEMIFGDLPSYRTQYVNVGGDLDELRNRLQSFCIRTLRRQVLEYIKYTERKPVTIPFKPHENEQKLYEAVTAFLRKDNSYAFPKQQKHLILLLVWKLLASSPQAVAGTLESIRDRLILLKQNNPPKQSLVEQIISNQEIDEELLDELLDEQIEEAEETEEDSKTEEIDREKLDAEIEEIGRLISWARSIGVNTKTRSLLKALKVGFEKMTDMGAAPKAVLFTESRRTQQLLKDFLEANGFGGQIVTFNGTNHEDETTAIYNQWIEKNKDTGRSCGSRQIDVRTAIIEHFRDHASIMIATEAGAEGINLQFCSLVINFDLPWNPQRIEQRIGRCHRYGQKHDVVVINFLNERNEADKRVYELLKDKFNLFTGIFGASDEVLGALESGIDFEKRILEIYQQCRTPEEIEQAFQKLQSELDEQIQTKLKDTRTKLLENFDEDVHARLRVNLQGTKEQLDWFSRMFWTLTQFILDKKAEFDDPSLTFQLLESPHPAIRTGKYHLITKKQQEIPSDFLYRLSHPLGEHVLEQGKNQDCPVNRIAFDITHHPAKISMVERLKGNKGYLILQKLTVDSFEHQEYLLFSAFDETGQSLDQETCQKLFNCSGIVKNESMVPDSAANRLKQEAQRHAQATIARSLEENNRHFQEARDQLEKWAEDMVVASEKELADTKAQIKALNRQARLAVTMDEQKQIQDQIQALEKKKRRQRQQIFEIEDEIERKRDALIAALEKRLTQKTSIEPLFTICWSVV
jgi:ERCC4-related helicase